MSSNLPDQLKQLQSTFEGVNSKTEEQEEALKNLRGHIQSMLYAPEPEQHHTLTERLEEAIVLFGSDYPDLATAINTTLTILANSGV